MSIPVRIAVRIDFADGSQHDYEVRGADAVDAPLVPVFFRPVVTAAEAGRLMREHGRLPAAETGGLSVRTAELPGWLPVTGKDGHGQPTPTVRELAAILRALPEEFQDLPVARYCGEGVAGIEDGLHYEGEHEAEEWTRHVLMW